MENNNLIVFKPEKEGAEFNVVLDGPNETVWLSQKQMSLLFEKDSDTIGLHLKRIFLSLELDENSTTEDFSVVRKEGKRNVKRQIRYYNLDAIISVGYRVNSKRGILFRKWATARLKEYLIQGYSINQKRLDDLKQSVRLIQKAAVLDDNSESKGIIKVLSDYALGLEILDGYDNQSLQVDNVTKTTSY